MAGRIPGRDKKYRGAFIISIDGKPVHDVETATLALAKAYDDPVQVETSILLCPKQKRNRSQRTRDIHVLTTEDIKNITAIRSTIDRTIETNEITQVIHAVNSGGLSDGAFALDEEKKIGHLTR